MDDALLVTTSLTGDRCAYEDLVRKYQNAVFGLAFSYVRNEQDAEDLVQDAFIKGYLRLETLADPARFGSWVRSIAVNEARQHLRKRRTVTARALNLDGAALAMERQALDDYRQEQIQAEIWEEVNALPELYRTPVILHYANRLSYEQIADFLGLEVSTVRGRLQKARAKMRTALEEEMVMKTVDVVDKVKEQIYKIARAEISAEIDPGRARHIVLHLDVPTSLQVVGHEGGKVLIRGHKVAVGDSQEGAEEVLSHIQLRHDEVEDWVEAGKHEGEQFHGTDTNSAGEPVACVSKSGGRGLKAFDQASSHTATGPGSIGGTDLFPHLAPGQDLLDRMRGAVPRGAHRVSLIFDKITDLVVPRAQVDDRLREGFSSNYWGPDWVHGHTGKARLEVSVPAGVTVSLVGQTVGATRVEGVRANVLSVGGRVAEIEDVEGDLFLLHTHVGSVKNLKGDLLQFCHERDENGRWGDGKRARPGLHKSELIDVRGDIELDVGHVDLSVHDPGGHVSIQNRTGSTTVSANLWTDGKRWRLENRTGDVAIQLPATVFEEQLISGSALAGEVDYSAIDREGLLTANSPAYMIFSTRRSYRDQEVKVNYLHSDVLVTAEGGNIRFGVLQSPLPDG